LQDGNVTGISYQVLKWIGESGENHQRAPWRYIPLAANDLNRENRKRCESRYGSEKLEP
jgi:hypothetical protein